MKTRVCRVCALSGVFCEKCEEMINKGEVKDIELSIAKILYEVEGKFKELQNVFLEQVIELNDSELLVLISSSSYLNPSFIANISKFLSEKFMKKVRVVEKSKDVKRLANQILYPIKILSVNEVWSPDGSHEYAIRLSQVDSKRLYNKTDIIEKILSKLLSSNVRIVVD